jgi:hypothetical protein
MTEEKATQIHDQYNELIKQIDLIDICTQSAHFENPGCDELPNTNSVSYTTKTWFINIENHTEFHAFQQYNVNIKDTKIRGNKKTIAKLWVIFRVTYSTKIPMNDTLFEIFQKSNLPLNTWPYFREFTHNSFTRMGWSKIIAPSYKIKRILPEKKEAK